MKKSIFILVVILLITQIGISQEQKKIQHKVHVVNVEVPFRVFFKRNPVGGLNKENFKLFVNGKETEINGFFETKKKIEVNQNISSTQNLNKSLKSRLFLLIFHISDYKLDMKKNVSYFFDNILKSGDRLIVISNNFFINDRVIRDPQIEKEKINGILKVESKKMRTRIIRIRSLLQSLLVDAGNMLQEGIDPEYPRRIFINSFLEYLKEFKNAYMDLDTTQYIKIADFLNNLDIEKWVINFYQIGGFYQPKLNSNFDQFLSGSILYRDLRRELDIADKLKENDLSKLFINTGATFHTILMRNSNRIAISNPSVGWKIYYRPIATNSENPLVNISKLTGGSIIRSNKSEKFFKEITQKEDIYYTLTYVPETDPEKNKRKIKITTNNKKFRVVYDDKQRHSYIRKMVKKQVDQRPQIIFNRVEFKENFLIFSFSNFEKRSLNNTSSGKIKLKIKILNSKGTKLFNRNKIFQTTKNKINLNIRIPQLKKGKYDFIIEVCDQFTGKNDMAIKEVVIPEKNKYTKL